MPASLTARRPAVLHEVAVLQRVAGAGADRFTAMLAGLLQEETPGRSS